MTIGIMQPYIFPYIGYFQLINSVDKFIIYDRVSFIKKGWINRNKILLNGKDFVFSVPLKNASSFEEINKTQIEQELYRKWIVRFLKTLKINYANASNFSDTYGLIASVFNNEFDSISELASNSIEQTMKYIGINTEFMTTAGKRKNPFYEIEEKMNMNENLTATDRVISICQSENATRYCNPIGGMSLYSKEYFAQNGIDLKFIKSKNVIYNQFKNEFVPWLSIIDVMMFNTPDYIKILLTECDKI
jgi:hypothetical protein